jgi:hypothetical protein
MTICAILVTVVATLFSSQANGQGADNSGSKSGNWLATRRYWTKGGVGGISDRLYVIANPSGKNELVLEVAEGKKESWKGKDWGEAEVVFVYQGRVLMPNKLPGGFDMSKAVVVSFEGSKIRFFDFQAMQGGYFDRT